MVRQRLEVLHDGGEKELIARAGKTSQPHALEAVVNLQRWYYCDRERSALGPTDRLRARSPALLSRDCPSALRINASTPGDIDVK